MNSTLAGWLQVGLLVAALAACYIPLGNYIAEIFTTDKHWRVERGIFRLTGIDPSADQTWGAYLRSMLAFSAVSVLCLYGMERLQHYLFGFLGQPMANVPPDTAWSTAVSFVTNTNWQNYSGESTMTYIVQMSGLAVQNFLSAAVGLVIAIAMIRGFVRSRTGIRTVMITGDNPLTAKAIADESGVDDFLAEATPEDKMALIRKEQEGGRLVAIRRNLLIYGVGGLIIPFIGIWAIDLIVQFIPGFGR